MKELSIEDKAKRFDEAIEKLRRLHDNYDTVSTLIDIKEELENIFPELKMSNSERIRNFISNELACLRAADEKGTVRYNELTEAIAWLEKQGEHQEYPKDVIDNAISFLANRNDGMPKEEAKDIVNAIITVLNPSYWPKQGEQKPAWSEENEEIYRKCICAMRASACGFPEEEKFVEQVDNWLKSLKERVQPKQEWSDEDEKMLKKSIKLFNEFGGDRESGAYTLQEMDCRKCADWLKALKDRVQPQTTWKPSDDEMKALAEALSLANNCGEEYAFDLRTLQDQLKKLK